MQVRKSMQQKLLYLFSLSWNFLLTVQKRYGETVLTVYLLKNKMQQQTHLLSNDLNSSEYVKGR